MIRVNGAGAVYLVLDGTLRHVPNPTTLEGLFNTVGGWKITEVTGLQDLTMGSALTDGALLVTGSGPHIYLLNDGEKRWIVDPTTFDKFGFDWTKVHTYPDVLINAIPSGADITATI